MSANRSVQAAQRRRAGPPDTNVSKKGPQPSINSSQMFAGQAPGRLQQGSKQTQEQPEKALKPKITIPQAIGLITLRLGAVETKLSNVNSSEMYGSNNSVSETDTEIIQSIMSRLESVEKRSGTAAPLTPELNLLKQQFETIKQTTLQTKTMLIKENMLLKSQIENLRKEFVETKELLTALQNLTINNSQKITDLSNDVYNKNGNENNENNVDELTNLDNELTNVTILDNEFTNLRDLHDETELSEIVGNNLKQIIESELNTSHITA